VGRRANNLSRVLPIFEEIENGGYSYADYKEHWAVHYSRAKENQLDVFHLPFRTEQLLEGIIAQLLMDQLLN